MRKIVQGPGKTYCYCPKCDRQLEGTRYIITKVVAMHMRYSHPETEYQITHLGKIPEQDHDMSIGSLKSIKKWEKKLENKIKIFD